jgi:hypothetical protein
MKVNFYCIEDFRGKIKYVENKGMIYVLQSGIKKNLFSIEQSIGSVQSSPQLTLGLRHVRAMYQLTD